MGGLIFLIVLAVFILIVIDILISYEFKKVADAKGHPNSKYFWITFFLGIVGMLLVISLPDRGNATSQIESQASEELPDL